jgi:hypothetical protein
MRLYIRLVAYLFVIMGFSGAFSGSYVDYVRAIEVDNADTIAALLAKGFDPLAMRDDAPKVDALAPNRNTPLMMAARYGAEDNVKRLLQRGANKQLLNDRKKSAAELAHIAERSWFLPLWQ